MWQILVTIGQAMSEIRRRKKNKEDLNISSKTEWPFLTIIRAPVKTDNDESKSDDYHDDDDDAVSAAGGRLHVGRIVRVSSWLTRSTRAWTTVCEIVRRCWPLARRCAAMD